MGNHVKKNSVYKTRSLKKNVETLHHLIFCSANWIRSQSYMVKFNFPIPKNFACFVGDYYGKKQQKQLCAQKNLPDKRKDVIEKSDDLILHNMYYHIKKSSRNTCIRCALYLDYIMLLEDGIPFLFIYVSTGLSYYW